MRTAEQVLIPYLTLTQTLAEQVLIPYLLAMLALVGLDHRFNNYEAQPLSLFALLPLLLSLMTALPLLRVCNDCPSSSSRASPS